MIRIITMKQQSKENRPYEKCMRLGPQALTDSELLAVIIRSGTIDTNSVKLAENVLCFDGKEAGLLKILHLSIQELTSIKGIGIVKAIQIKCVAELSRRIHKTQFKTDMEFINPHQIAEYYMEDLRHLETEHLYLVMLNTKHMFIGDFELSKGTVNASLISPREAFIEALKMRAVYVVLIHNHPSGDSTPSKEDILTTKRMKNAGDIIGISLIDHIIIGDNNYVSLREYGAF